MLSASGSFSKIAKLTLVSNFDCLTENSITFCDLCPIDVDHVIYHGSFLKNGLWKLKRNIFKYDFVLKINPIDVSYFERAFLSRDLLRFLSLLRDRLRFLSLRSLSLSFSRSRSLSRSRSRSRSRSFDLWNCRKISKMNINGSKIKNMAIITLNASCLWIGFFLKISFLCHGLNAFFLAPFPSPLNETDFCNQCNSLVEFNPKKTVENKPHLLID